MDAQTGCPPWTWSRRCWAQPRRGVPPRAGYDDPPGGDWHRMRMPGPCPAAWCSGSGACLRILQEGASDAQRGLSPQVGWGWGARWPPCSWWDSGPGCVPRERNVWFTWPTWLSLGRRGSLWSLVVGGRAKPRCRWGSGWI